MKPFLMLLCLCLLLCSCAPTAPPTFSPVPAEEPSPVPAFTPQTVSAAPLPEVTPSPAPVPLPEEGLKVVVFSAGKADAILLCEGEHAVLIDAGLNKTGKVLAPYLVSQSIEELDLMLITHFDKDHVGGADKVLESVAVKEVICPDYVSDSKQFEQFITALDEQQVPCRRITETEQRTFGGIAMTLYPALESFYGPGEDNAYSIVSSVIYGKTSFLFAADAEEVRLEELMRQLPEKKHDFLKVPYHGRLEPGTLEFLEAVSPKVAVITDSEEDMASSVVVQKLTDIGAQVCSTRDGDVLVTSDGETLCVKQ